MADDSLEIPASARKEIFERDGGICRMCGTLPTWPTVEIHHIIYGGDLRGMGGRRVHEVSEMVSLCRPCHMRAHSRKLYWQPILLRAVQSPGVTAFQIARWTRAREARAARSRRVG